MPDPKTYKQHFENKHPKNDMPEDLKAVVWWIYYNQLDFIDCVYKKIKYTKYY